MWHARLQLLHGYSQLTGWHKHVNALLQDAAALHACTLIESVTASRWGVSMALNETAVNLSSSTETDKAFGRTHDRDIYKLIVLEEALFSSLCGILQGYACSASECTMLDGMCELLMSR